MSDWLFEPAQEASFRIRRMTQSMRKDRSVALSQKNLAVDHMLFRIRDEWLKRQIQSRKFLDLWRYVERNHDTVIRRTMYDVERHFSLASGKNAATICNSVDPSDSYAQEAKRMKPITVGDHTYLVDNGWTKVLVPLGETVYINAYLENWVDRQEFLECMDSDDEELAAFEFQKAESTHFTKLDIGDVFHELVSSPEVKLPCDGEAAEESWLFAMEADLESVLATTKSISEKLGTMDQTMVRIVQKSQYTANDVSACQEAVRTVEDLTKEVKKLYSMGDKLANAGRKATNTIVHGTQAALVIGGTVGGVKLGKWAGESGFGTGLAGLVAGSLVSSQISKLKLTNHGPGANKHDGAQLYLQSVNKDLKDLAPTELRKFLNCLLNDLRGLEEDYVRVATYVEECVVKNDGRPLTEATESYQFIFN